MLSKLFPLLDYLYIFQLVEYDRSALLSFFFNHPLRRNLQKKNHLDFTPKIQLLAFLSSFTMLLLSVILTILFFKGSLLILVVIYILLESISPFFIIFSSFIISPIDNFQKYRITQKAKRKIKNLNLTTVAIVGSFAKTSTKNILYALLWKDFYVVKTPKSYNTPVAIASTILSYLKPTTQIFIVEMDAYHPGDIKNLCKIAKPDLAIITAIAPQHLERFGSLQKLADSQFEVGEALKENGTLFLNSLDEQTMQTQDKFDVKKTFFGGEMDKFRIENLSNSSNNLNFDLILEKEKIKIQLPLQGEHNAYNFLAAATIAYKLGLPAKTIEKRAKLILPTEHRGEIKKQGPLTIIDNSYNTNPKVVVSSLKLLTEVGEKKHKILITPGLIEQGKNAEKENKKFINLAAGVADEIIIVGESFKKYLKKGLDESNFPKNKTHFVKSTKSAMELTQKLSAGKECVISIENDLPDQYI